MSWHILAFVKRMKKMCPTSFASMLHFFKKLKCLHSSNNSDTMAVSKSRNIQVHKMRRIPNLVIYTHFTQWRHTTPASLSISLHIFNKHMIKAKWFKRNLNLLHFTELNFNIKNVQNIRLKTFCLAIHFHFEVLQKQRYCNLLNKLTLSN